MSPATFSRCIFSSLVVMLALCGCGAEAERDDGRHRLTGMVVERDEIRSQLTIAHDEVAGLMPAMTMPFRIANLQPDVQPGDVIGGTLVLLPDGDSWIEDVRVTQESDGSFVPALSTSLAIGAKLPAFTLVNQDGAAMSLQALQGQFVVLSFIYTTCPFPDYCPLIMNTLTRTAVQVAGHESLKNQVRFVAVTIDPAHDTPEVLRAYGQRMIPGTHPFDNFDLLTGSPAEIARMAGWFGLTAFAEREQIVHSLMTAVIDAEGHILEILPGNEWQPADVVTAIQESRAGLFD